VSKTRQAEVRAREEVRTQDEEAREERGPGEDRIQEALETAAEVARKTGGLGTPGRPVNRRSPFMIGLTAALGVAVAYGRPGAAAGDRVPPARPELTAR
jgi:hypothetical protein